MKSTLSAFSHAVTMLAILPALSACAVGPDYEKPNVATPDVWVSDDMKDMMLKSDVDHEWWKNFNDPILTELIDKAANNNFDLKAAEARIAEARAYAAGAGASLWPQGDVRATATREANQLALPGGAGGALASSLRKPFNIFQTGFDASWELDLFGGTRRNIEAAEAQMSAAEASRDDIRVSVFAEVARAYVGLRAAQTRAETIDALVQNNREALKIAEQRFAAGQSPRAEVMLAEARLEQTQAQIPLARSQIAQMEFALDALLGEQPGSVHARVAEAKPIPRADRKLVLAAPASVLAQRPDIRTAERRLAAATAQQGAALAKFFPDISLGGFFGALNTSLTKLATPANKSWVASGTILWPILSYNSLSANLDAADAQQQEAMALYQKSVIGALSDVERSLSAFKEQEHALQAVVHDVEKNRQLQRIAQERHKTGLTSKLEFLETARAVYAAQDRLTQAEAASAQNFIALYKSLGGGWIKTTR